MTETLIKIENLHKSFGKNEVLKGINLEIKRGEVVVIIGPSGSGKSTLLRSMNLLEEATKGKVIFEGVDITDKKNDLFAMREKMGMVFQQFNLFPNMTVMENITLSPIKTKGESREVAEKRAQELLEKLVCQIRQTLIHRVCRVGNNNGLPSRVGWLWNQMFCSLTNQLQPWILKW
ncbi:amino acid ABC transporter ATP-binding protein [Streptococcus pneumoniae]|nr:amino acid ABC transporter ATP-binding protein [Streptococcus pneumoniae]